MKIPQFDDDAFGYLDGTFDATIISAEEKTSKSGNPMIAIKMEAVNRKGDQVSVMDWLVAVSQKMCLEKIQGFIRSAGLQIDDELTAAACEGAEVQIVCEIEDDVDRGRNTQVRRYVGSPYERLVADSNADVVGVEPGRDPGDPF